MKFTIKIIGSLLIVAVLSGCSTKMSICPKYPKPSQEVLNSLKMLNNKKVDEWIEQQYKLNKKLDICN